MDKIEDFLANPDFKIPTRNMNSNEFQQLDFYR